MGNKHVVSLSDNKFKKLIRVGKTLNIYDTSLAVAMLIDIFYEAFCSSKYETHYPDDIVEFFSRDDFHRDAVSTIKDGTENLGSIKFAKLTDDAIRPTRAHDSDAGIDLYAAEEAIIEPNGRVGIETGIAIKIPDGHVGLVLNRSGLNFKRDITAAVGVIDSGYTGAIKVMLENHSKYGERAAIHKGDKIAQIVIVPCMLGDVEEISRSDLGKTERGSNGFGSTGISYEIVDD